MTGENTEMCNRDKDYRVDDLVRIGFESVAIWKIDSKDKERIAHEANEELFEVKNALYAFCCGGKVLYIGKTTQGLKRRLRGYHKPDVTQTTNCECNEKIREKIKSNSSVEILAFAPQEDLLKYRGFQINLAAGLEDILIREFGPEWNRLAKERNRSNKKRSANQTTQK